MTGRCKEAGLYERKVKKLGFMKGNCKEVGLYERKIKRSWVA